MFSVFLIMINPQKPTMEFRGRRCLLLLATVLSGALVNSQFTMEEVTTVDSTTLDLFTDYGITTTNATLNVTESPVTAATTDPGNMTVSPEVPTSSKAPTSSTPTVPTPAPEPTGGTTPSRTSGTTLRQDVTTTQAVVTTETLASGETRRPVTPTESEFITFTLVSGETLPVDPTEPDDTTRTLASGETHPPKEPTEPSSTSPPDEGEPALSTGAIVGIAVGGVVALLAAAAVGFAIYSAKCAATNEVDHEGMQMKDDVEGGGGEKGETNPVPTGE